VNEPGRGDGRSIIGRSLERQDARDKVTGRARYTVDLAVPGMIEGKVLRSPYAHARIVSIDTSKAARHPGVLAVLTGADLTDIDPYFGQAVRDQPVLAIERVRFAGEPVVAVAAVDALSAEEALRRVSVEYAPLPVIRTIDEALMPTAPQLHVDRPRSTLFPDVQDIKPATSATTSPSAAAMPPARLPRPISSSTTPSPCRAFTTFRSSRWVPSPTTRAAS